MGSISRLSIFAFTFLAICQLSGCQTQPKGTFCAVASPIRPSQETIDRLSDAEVAALLAHNKRGGKLCGWQP